MRLFLTSSVILFLSFLLHGCASNVAVDHDSFSSSAVAKSSLEMADQLKGAGQRKEIVTASITITSEDIASVVERVEEIVLGLNGYVENTNQKEKRSYVTARVPKDAIDVFFENLEGLGEVSGKSISRRDVTEQHADVRAQLENLKSLRDRYRQLLAKAKDVKDMIEIERELNRIQFDLDRLEGQLKNLNQSIDYASVSVTVKQKTVLGPVGWIFKTSVDLIGKLIIWK